MKRFSLTDKNAEGILRLPFLHLTESETPKSEMTITTITCHHMVKADRKTETPDSKRVRFPFSATHSPNSVFTAPENKIYITGPFSFLAS
jgi:hypothetical protein